MKRIEFDEEFMYQINLDLMKSTYDGQTDEFYHQKAVDLTALNKRQNIQFNCKQKLIEYNMSETEADAESHYLIDDLPEELFQNVLEWIDDKPFSEINYCGMSIPKIMNDFKKFHFGTNMGFLKALNTMNVYIKCGCKNKDIVYSMYRFDGGTPL